MNMTLPLLRYLQLHSADKWVRIGLDGVYGIDGCGHPWHQSRGALLGLIVTGLWLILKSPKRSQLLAMALVGSHWGCGLDAADLA